MESSLTHRPVERPLSRRLQTSLLGEGALVGVAAGVLIALYRLALSQAELLLRAFTAAAAASPLTVAAWFAVLTVVLAVVWRLIRLVPDTGGSGIPQIDGEVMGRLDMSWPRVIVAKFAEGTLLAFSGLSLGREGPSVQLGGMAGKGVSRSLRRERGEERILVTCGAAAGMSAAFHAPLAGVLFAIEEIHREFSAALIIPVMGSTAVADFLVSRVLGVAPVLSLEFVSTLPHLDYGLVLALGLACGVLGELHNRGMFACQRLYDRLGPGVTPQKLAVPFAVAGLAAFLWPDLMCGGDAIVERLLSPTGISLAAALALLAGKYAFTTACFGSGAPGGTLFPLVVMGGLVGGAFSLLCTAALGVPDSYFPNFVALGVAGLFSGVVRAPVTAVVLVFELTGSFNALLSLAAVSLIAYVTANLFKGEAFYEHLVVRLLEGLGDRGPSRIRPLGSKVLATARVGVGSGLEGKLVREVPWPDGVRLLTIERAGAELAPTGETRLCALDELLYIVDRDAAEDAGLKLSLMCEQRLR